MNSSKQPHTAFSSLSSFTALTQSRPSQTCARGTASSHHHPVTMVAPKHVRRSDEIKRLSKQLEELRAIRERMEEETSTSPPTSTPVAQRPPETPSPPPVRPPTTSKPSSFKVGKHSEGSHFLSVSDFPFDQHAPRILPVAGIVPGLTTSQFHAVPRLMHSTQPRVGSLFTTKLPEGYDGEFMAMILSENFTEYIDPLVLKVEQDELSPVQLPCAKGDYVYIVVDRGTADSPFDYLKFYAWDVDGMVKVGWANDEPAEEEARCLGKVLFGTLEVRKELRKKRSCWEEENETYA